MATVLCVGMATTVMAASPDTNTTVPTPAPVESEHTLANGEEARMVTVKGDRDVYVIGNPDLVPAGASFESTSLTSGAAYESAKAAVAKKFGSAEFVAFEMNLFNANNAKITQLNGYINVTLPVPAGMATENGESIVVYRVENGKMYKCDTAVADGQVTFATNHFSTYVLVEVNAMTSPKTADVMVGLYAVAALTGTVVAARKVRKNK